MQELPLGKTQLRRKLDAPLEAAVRDLQSQYIGIPARRRQRAGAGDQKRLPFDLDAYRLRRNAREGGDDADLPVGLEHIDRGLPAGSAGSSARRLEELAVKLLGPLQQRARFGPHVVFRVTHHIFSLEIATLEQYRGHTRLHIVPLIGEIKLTDLTHGSIWQAGCEDAARAQAKERRR
jgi:hypothetical protein